jgi:NAD(P)-dependent dehydrogenase (short-subunit alcohol dehydrogenase family)
MSDDTRESPVYLVLGASGGIGSALSRALHERGAGLVLAADLLVSRNPL